MPITILNGLSVEGNGGLGDQRGSSEVPWSPKVETNNDKQRKTPLRASFCEMGVLVERNADVFLHLSRSEHFLDGLVGVLHEGLRRQCILLAEFSLLT